MERDFDGATRLLSNYTFALPNLKNRLPKKYTACLPFSGFYDSLWSSVSDREIENMAEWEAFEKQNEVGTPSELRLAESDFTQALNGCFDYAKFKRDMSAAYVDVFKDYSCAGTPSVSIAHIQCYKSTRCKGICTLGSIQVRPNRRYCINTSQ